MGLSKIKWPPKKSWTRILPIKGYRHFVAINYGGEGKDRWLNLVSVLDGEVRLRILWNEIIDNQMWLSGWVHKEENEIIKHADKSINKFKNKPIEKFVCLHTSEDSGLQIPTKIKKIRKWDDE